jgi:hypothetical protein
MDDDNKLSSKPEAVPNMPTRKSKQFRDALLTRLPRLRSPNWDASAVFDVHESMAGLRDLGADALLEPLASLADARHD